MDAGREELAALTDAYNEGIHTIKLYTERQTDHDVRCRELTGSIEAQEAELAALAGQMADLLGQTDRLNAEIMEQEERVGRSQAALERAQAEQGRAQARIGALKDDFFEFMRFLAEQRNRQRNFDERRQNLKAQAAAGGRRRSSVWKRNCIWPRVSWRP